MLRCRRLDRERLAQRLDELRGALEAVCGIPRHRRGDNLVDTAWELGPNGRRLGRLIVQVRVHELYIGLALVRHAAGETGEEDAAERVDVRAAVDRLPLDLLRGGVVEVADEEAGLGHAFRRDRPRDAEVSQVGAVARRDEDVARGHVAMHQPLAVGGVEGIRDLLEDRERSGGRKRTFELDQFGQVGPLDEPHEDVEVSGGLAGIEHLDDVRVLDRRCDAPLPFEALAEGDVACELGGQQLQCADTVELLVPGAVDHTHSAASEH